ILYKNAEKILYQNEDFMIIQDYNSKDNEDILNCLGIPFNNTIKSIRDLNETHLELLSSFYHKGKEALAKIYNVDVNKIRCFVHYPPSFFYFHVHYLNVDYESHSTSVNRAIDLYSIIQNIKMKSDYYQNCDLEINVQISSKLYDVLNK